MELKEATINKKHPITVMFVVGVIVIIFAGLLPWNKPSTYFNNGETIPPTIGSIKQNYNGNTKILLKNNYNEYKPIAITSKSEKIIDYSNYYISFNITNMNEADLIIDNIFIKVKSCEPLEKINKINKFKSVGFSKKYYCIIDNDIKKYRCNFETRNGYLFLKKGEHKIIEIGINAYSQGKYELDIIVDYSIDGNEHTLNAGSLKEVRFIDI